MTAQLLKILNTHFLYQWSGWHFKVSALQFTGKPSAVGDLNLAQNSSHIILNWIQPFSLNITGVSPDVTYCVQVLAEGLSPPENTKSCEIERTEFSYPLPTRHWCYNYFISITPQNLAGMGASSSFSYVTPEPEQRELHVHIRSYILCNHARLRHSMFNLFCSMSLGLGPIIQDYLYFPDSGSEMSGYNITLIMVRELYIAITTLLTILGVVYAALILECVAV